MTDQIAFQVVRRMIAYATSCGDILLFHGSPREIMEEVDVSSGPLYNKLYDLGLRRQGKGSTATWEIPSAVVDLVRALT